MAKIVHFTVGRPKKNASNGVLRSVFMLSGKQSEFNHSVKCYYFSKNKSSSRNIDQAFGGGVIACFQAYSKLLKLKPNRIYIHGGGHWRFWIILILYLLFNNRMSKIVFVPRGAYSSGVVKRRNNFNNYILRFFETFLVRQTCQYVQALNSREARDIEHFIKITSQNLVIIPNAILDCSHTYTKSISKGNLILVFCGRLDWHGKGIDVLFETLKKQDDLSTKMELWLIGPFSSSVDKSIILQKINENCLPVKMFGELFGEEKWKIILSGDIFVLPSRSEGSPTGLLEAAATGMPCIASLETNLDKSDFDAGIHLCELNSNSIIEAVQKVIARNNKNKSRQANHIKRFYNLNSVVAKHDELFS